VGESIVDLSSVWEEETASWGELVHVKQLLITTDQSVVALLSLLFEVDVFIELLLAWE